MPIFYTKGAFFKAIDNNDTETVAAYLKKDAQRWAAVINDRDDSVFLDTVGRMHREKMIGLLLRHGVRATDDAVWHAVYGERMENVELLLENGGSFQKALITAAELGKKTMVEGLLERGPVEPSQLSSVFSTALNNGKHDIALILLKAGVPLDTTYGADRKSLLHVAAKNGATDVAGFLLDKGADIDARDKDGWTPLYYAVSQNAKEMAAFLLDRGADKDIRSNDGKTALDRARKNDCKEIILLLDPPVPMSGAEKWAMMGPDKIAHIGIYPATGLKLTEIFDFAACDRRTVTENLDTKAQSTGPAEKFCDLDETVVAAAYEAFKKAGGKADETRIFKGHLRKTAAPSLRLAEEP